MDQLTRSPVDPDRIHLSREADFQLGALTVRPSRREVAGLGECHLLQPRVMQVLVALACPSSEVVSQDELIRRCWSGLSVSDDAIGRCISQLRKLAARWPEPPFAIVTIAGVGYRLDVLSFAAQGDLPQPPTAAAEPAGDRRWRMYAVIAAALVVLAAGALWFANRAGFGETSPAKRVAVIALDPLSPRPESRYLAAGIADEVDRTLSDSQIEALPRTDAEAVRAAADPRAAAQLGVGLVLTGSIGQAGDDTVVNMRLESAATHVILWSGDFRRADANASALREEIPYKVADVVALAEFARETPGMRKDDAALSALLQAHELLRSNRSGSWGQLLALSQRVVASEPDFAFGHAMAATADVYALGWGAPAQQRPALIANGRQEAARALALDPHDAAAYFALYILESDYARKEAVLRKGLAVATRPTAPLAALYDLEGAILSAVGRPHDALPYFQRAVGLDPLSPVKAESLVKAYELAGETGAAQELIGQALARWPGHRGLRAARLHLLTFYGSPEAARALLATPADLPADMAPEAVAAWRQYLAATPAHASETARAVDRAAEDGALELRTAVLMLARLHDLDHAFALADKLANEPTRDPRFLFESVAGPLRRDARFPRLAARFGLTAYWRSTGRWPDICSGPQAELDCRAAFSAAGI